MNNAIDSHNQSGDVLQLARDVGARPFVFLALLLAAGALLLVVLVLTVRWSGSHARVVWKHATRSWRKLEARPFMRALEARVPWVWRAMRSLSATEYLAIHLGIGFTVVVALVCFIKLAGWVAEGETMVAVDLALASSLRASASQQGIAVMSVFTSLGGGRGITALGVVVGVVLAWKKRRLLLIGWTVALVGAGILSNALKAGFARERPVFEQPITLADGWSFPSGHAMATFVATGMLAYLGFALVKTPGRRLLLAGLALLWTVAMGFSRMYLGVHYLSDVVAGFAAGTVWLGACISGIEIARHPPAGRRPGRAPPPRRLSLSRSRWRRARGGSEHASIFGASSPGGPGCLRILRTSLHPRHLDRKTTMLWTIALVLLVLWAVGLLTSYTLGGFVHILLAVALIMFLVSVIQGRRVRA